jgi:hypothetical protein
LNFQAELVQIADFLKIIIKKKKKNPISPKKERVRLKKKYINKEK